MMKNHVIVELGSNTQLANQETWLVTLNELNKTKLLQGVKILEHVIAINQSINQLLSVHMIINDVLHLQNPNRSKPILNCGHGLELLPQSPS